MQKQILFKCNGLCSSCNISSNLDAIRCVTHHLCVPRMKQIFLVELQRASDCRLSIIGKDFWVEGGWAQRQGWTQMPNKTPKTRICEKERAWSKYAFASESLTQCHILHSKTQRCNTALWSGAESDFLGPLATRKSQLALLHGCSAPLWSVRRMKSDP